jgi:hypothetical protein
MERSAKASGRRRLARSDARALSRAPLDWLQDEDPDCNVGIDVVVAHEAGYLSSGKPFDLAAAGLLHDLLPEPSQPEHSFALARVYKVALAFW